MSPNLPSPIPDAARYRDELIDLSTGVAIEVTEWRCWDPAAEPGGPPPLPPLPPSPEEVFDRAGIPRPEVNISPFVRGLVGLETWLWYDQVTEVTATVDLAGWHAEVTARIVRYEYDLGNGDGTGDPWQPTEGNPYTYVYSHDCACTVTATTW
ncbi:MAG: hypothetical protein ACRD0A_15100 [Acidimicrobiales bacterium]